MQDREKSIQPASNEGSDSVDDGVERIEGSSSNFSELNDSGDQEIDSQQEQEAEEMIVGSRGAFHSTKYSDEWNSIFRFVGLPNPRSSCSKFRA